MFYELEKIADKVFKDGTVFPQVRTLTYINGYDHYEKDGNLFIEVNAAGFSKKDLSLSIDDGLLKVKADSKGRDSLGFTKHGLSKSITLPKQADIDSIEATTKNGVLTVKVPLIDKKKTIKIK